MDIIQILLSFVAPICTIAVAVIGFVLNQKLERKKRAETFQAEKIEWILTAIADNGTAHTFLETNNPELVTVKRNTQKALSLVPIYGNQEVIDFCKELENDQYSSHDIHKLSELLTKQARSLLNLH